MRGSLRREAGIAGLSRSAVAVALVLAGWLSAGTPAAVSAGGDPVEVAEGETRLRERLYIDALNRTGRAALTGSPAELGGFLPAFDRRLNTVYRARDPGPAEIACRFDRPFLLRSVVVYPGSKWQPWTVTASFPPGPPAQAVPAGDGVIAASRSPRDRAAELPAGGILAAGFTLRLQAPPGERAEVGEIVLTADQVLESVAVEPRTRIVPLGGHTPLQPVGYFSGGAVRPIAGRRLRWSVRPESCARVVSGDRLLGRRKGPVEILLTVGDLKSLPVRLDVVDPE